MKNLISSAILASFVIATTSHAVTVDGRSGPQEFSTATIATDTKSCIASYETSHEGNFIISSGPNAEIFVRQNSNMVNARCQFTDVSGVFETNAEVGPIADCRLITDLGFYTGGTGKVTAAANNDPKQSDIFGGTGGNVTMHCTFDPSTFVPHP